MQFSRDVRRATLASQNQQQQQRQQNTVIKSKPLDLSQPELVMQY